MSAHACAKGQLLTEAVPEVSGQGFALAALPLRRVRVNLGRRYRLTHGVEIDDGGKHHNKVGVARVVVIVVVVEEHRAAAPLPLQPAACPHGGDTRELASTLDPAGYM